MSKLYLTTCFHGNLGYSSISEERRPEVLRKCYWPLISLAEKLDIKLAFEFPAQTLEIIDKLDHSLLLKIRELSSAGRIELVGAGFVQSIFPLIPAQVNRKCLELGNRAYRALIGAVPSIAFVNEHVYSRGLVKLYKEAGYKAIIMDWVNSKKSNPKLSKCKFTTANVKGIGEEAIGVLWNNTLLFQKLQRYVYGDIELKEYVDYVKSYFSSSENRVLMAYGNDMEVFDFRPRDPKTMHSGEVRLNEIERIEAAFRALKEENFVEFILPGEALRICHEKTVYDVGSGDYPVITKKQDKYNVLRWAVSGRNNYISNTQCHKIYNMLNDGEHNDAEWKEIVELWASDFRTHTEEKRYAVFKERLAQFTFQEPGNTEKAGQEIQADNDTIETHKVKLRLSKKKGGTIAEMIFKEISQKPIIKTIPPEFYEDATFSVDLFSGHTIILEGRKQYTDLNATEINYVDMGDKIKAACACRISESLTITKEYYVHKSQPLVELAITIDATAEIRPTFARTGILTFNPEAFDKKTLYYSTLNGGDEPEKYALEKSFDQSAPIDLRISARHCLGATGGWLEIGDNKTKFVIKTDKSLSYSVPMLKYEDLGSSFVLRVINTFMELDETTNTVLSGKHKFWFSFEGTKNE